MAEGRTATSRSVAGVSIALIALVALTGCGPGDTQSPEPTKAQEATQAPAPTQDPAPTPEPTPDTSEVEARYLGITRPALEALGSTTVGISDDELVDYGYATCEMYTTTGVVDSVHTMMDDSYQISVEAGDADLYQLKFAQAILVGATVLCPEHQDAAIAAGISWYDALP